MELSVYCDTLSSPAHAAALCDRLIAETRERTHPVLCAYVLPGDVLALGRFHAVPPENPAGGVVLGRRKSGGRVAPLGDGYVALALGLPHWGALTGADPGAVEPEQVLNRAVRGVLGALQSLGISAYYPGRDLITVEGRVLAALGFETAPDGTTLVEACVAVGRSFAEISGFADRADPAGQVPIDLMLPDAGTSLLQAIGRAPDLDEVTAALAGGYAARLGLDVSMGEGIPRPDPDPGWIGAGRVPPHLDRHAAARDQLGVVEVYAACAGGRVTDVRVCGDLIAPSAAVARLEAALRDAPLDRDTLRRRAIDVVEGQGGVLLGVRSSGTIGELVHTACVG